MKHTPHTLAAEVAEKPKEMVFPGSTRFLFFYILAPVVVATPIIFLLIHRNPTLDHLLRDLLMLPWLIPLLCGVASLLSSWTYRVRVKAEGIHGGTLWSTPVYMTFAEMESVEPRTVVGMPYLRVKSFRETCPTLWLPLFLADPKAFREHIAAQTAPPNPLRRSLESGNTAQKREPLPLPR